MGTFSDSLKKWFYTQGTQAATSSSRIPLLDASGNPVGSDTPDNLFKQQPLFTAGVGVATLSDSTIRLRQPHEAATQTSIAVGAWINVGTKMLIVAKDTQALAWSTSSSAGGTAYKVTRTDALADMDGQANTATIYSTLGNAAPAAKYCLEYKPSNVDIADETFGAGHWWLPSGGEMWMMYSHLLELNRVLTMMGGTPLPSVSHWGSTEYSKTSAWYLRFSNGTFYSDTKTGERAVRPVTTF